MNSFKNIFLTFGVIAGSFFVFSDAHAQVCDADGNGTPDENFSQFSYALDASGGSAYAIGDVISTTLSFRADGSDGSSQDKSAIMLILDKSPSMGWSASECGTYCYTPPTKITLAKSALTNLVSQMELSGSHSLPGLVSFDANAYGTLESNFTDDYTGLRQRINGISLGNGTRLEGGLLTAADAFRNKSDVLREYGVKGKYIILISDGKNDPSTTPATEKAAIDGIESDITVFTIGIGAHSYLDQGKLQRIASAGKGDGEYFYLSDFNQLQAKLDEIMKKISRPFSVKDVTVTLSKSVASHIALLNSSGNQVSQVKLVAAGSFNNGDTVSFPIKYKALHGGLHIPLNDQNISIDYTNVQSGNECKVFETIPVLNVDVFGQCSGTIPNNSTPCGNGQIFENAQHKAVNSCSGGGCEYVCQACYAPSSNGTSCEDLHNGAEARCGSVNGGRVCGLQNGMCASGQVVGARLENGMWKWNCTAACSISPHASVSCSAEQNCGWVEVAP